MPTRIRGRPNGPLRAGRAHTATKLLVSDDEARITTIAEAVTRELFWLIPHDRGAEISVRDRKVTVTLGEPVADAVSGG